MVIDLSKLIREDRVWKIGLLIILVSENKGFEKEQGSIEKVVQDGTKVDLLEISQICSNIARLYSGDYHF